MGLLLNRKIDKYSRVGLWKITEKTEELFSKLRLEEKDQLTFQNFTHPQRKLQWLAVRNLTNKLLGKNNVRIRYDRNSKPQINNNPHYISISHTKQYAAVILNKKDHTGIDIELISPRIKKIEHKFMSEQELNSLQPFNHIEQFYVYWSAKESLYKLYGKKKLDFKENLFIEPFKYKSKGIITGKIIKGNKVQPHKLRYEKKDSFMLVYVLNSLKGDR